MLAGHGTGSDPHVSTQEAAAESDHQGSSAQREPGRNVHAILRRLTPNGASHT
jgi:hypothetical protein